MKQPPEEFSSAHMPHLMEPVLAIISRVSELGLSRWHEVVYYDVWDKQWYSYHGSNTFDVAGDTVEDWVYCSRVFEDKE